MQVGKLMGRRGMKKKLVNQNKTLGEKLGDGQGGGKEQGGGENKKRF